MPATFNFDLVSKARQVLRGAALAKPTGVMASDPMTAGSALGTSTINASATSGGSFNSSTGATNCNVAFASPFIERGPVEWYIAGGGGYLCRWVTQNAGLTRAAINGTYIRFGFDGQQFDVSMIGNATTGFGNFRCRVTNLDTGVREWTATSDYVAATGDPRFYLFNFGSRARRVIELYFGRSMLLRGLNIGANDTIFRAPQPDAARVMVFGDSYVANNTGCTVNLVRGGFAPLYGDLIGCDNALTSGVGSSGWVDPDANNITWLDRINNGDFAQSLVGEMDLITIFSSINDNGYTDAAVTAAMNSGLLKIREEQPGAIIIHAGPQRPGGAQTAQGRYDAMAAQITATKNALNDEAIFWIDNSPSGENWMTGTGRIGSATGSGNNDLYVSSDNLHVVDAGHAYLANRLANATIRTLTPLTL